MILEVIFIQVLTCLAAVAPFLAAGAYAQAALLFVFVLVIHNLARELVNPNDED